MTDSHTNQLTGELFYYLKNMYAAGVDSETTAKIKEAIEFATEAHKGQVREVSGEPFINHPLRVTLAAMKFAIAPVSIQASILHDVLEDTNRSAEEISGQFGGNVLRRVLALTKPERLRIAKPGIEKEEMTSKYYRGIMYSTPDVRTIKVCDRISNLQEMDGWNRERQYRYLQETLKYIAPIAICTNPKLAAALSEAVIPVQDRLETAEGFFNGETFTATKPT